jgi:hypothetical protein
MEVPTTPTYNHNCCIPQSLPQWLAAQMPRMFLSLSNFTVPFNGCNAAFPTPGKHKESRVQHIIHLNNFHIADTVDLHQIKLPYILESNPHLFLQF